MKNCFYSLLSFVMSLFFFTGCTYEKFESQFPETMYPADVEAILGTRCSISGCHNSQSSQGAGGLELTTWNRLFEGSRSGSVVIPYRPDFSTLCYYTNTDTLNGPVLQPTMPYNNAPLSDEEYETLRSWIENGAPDKNGFIKFSDYQDKPKLYICNRGCDVVTVLDPASGLPMRYIDVGSDPEIEGPCMVKVAPGQEHWYVIFNQGTMLQKFRTADNVKVGELSIGPGIWTSIIITPDSKHAYISDADFNGRILYLNVETMQILAAYQAGLRYPYGLCISNSTALLYATSKEGNYIYKIDVSHPMNPVISEISLETGIAASTTSLLNPCSILLSPDESRYFVICNQSAELRIMQASNDSLLGVFATGSNPVEAVVSSGYPRIFVSCLGVPGTNKKSMINVFDYSSGTPLAEVLAGHDSKGLAVDESVNKLYVANRNVSEGGPAAHHAPMCDGKNGYLTAIDLATLQVVPDFKIELSVDPYYIGK